MRGSAEVKVAIFRAELIIRFKRGVWGTAGSHTIGQWGAGWIKAFAFQWKTRNYAKVPIHAAWEGMNEG